MDAHPAPTTRSLFPTVDMGPAGMVTIEVLGGPDTTYREAHAAAVEQMLVDPEAAILHGLRARLRGEM